MKKLPVRLILTIGLVLLCCLGFAAPASADGPINYVIAGSTEHTCDSYTDTSI